jgi:transcriptional regulator with XRE-family HTH domain
MRAVKTPKRPVYPLSRNLWLLRDKAGMTQRQLAAEAGLTQAAISRIEGGKIRDVRSRTLDVLARILGVTPSYLAGRSDLLSPTEATRFEPQLAQYAGMLALLPPDAVNRVYGFISSEVARAKEAQEREGRGRWEPTAARDTPSEPFGPGSKS